jgi:GT2 family glycosyltransferase
MLLAAIWAENADAAHPLTTDGEGRLSWFPGLLDRQKLQAAREHPKPCDFVTHQGSLPTPFSWSQGIALLITRRVLEELGPHRTDYWVRGEDLEFTLRITAHHRGIYVPTARVQHLPPASSNDPTAEYPKHIALLRNLAYTSLRLKHGRRIARTLPGNWLRFLRTWGFSPRALMAILTATLRGLLKGPAGAG